MPTLPAEPHGLPLTSPDTGRALQDDVAPSTLRDASRARPKNPGARRALGEVLRELRTRRGWSQERLAHTCGYDRAYVGQLERGQRWPTVEAVWYVLHALGASWEEFGAAMQSARALRAAPAPREGRGA